MFVRIYTLIYLILSLNVLFAQDGEKTKTKNIGNERIADIGLMEQEIYDEAVLFLRRGNSVQALKKLFELSELVGKESEITDKINVLIAEGYRQQREYEKGLDLLYRVINKSDVNREVQTQAFTRIAAIYNEAGFKNISRTDSVIKYSNLSIKNSQKYNFPYHMATSQNELGYVYAELVHNYPKAIDFLTESLETFLSLEMNEDASYVALNLCKAYADSDDVDMAETIIDNAMKYCPPDSNELLFMRLYFQKAKISAQKKDYKTAYEYLFKSRNYNGLASEKQINQRIFELTAKFETEKLKKENELQLLKISNKSLTIKYLIIGVTTALLLVIVIYYVLRKRTIAYKSLVAKNLELANCDRKILESGEFIPESFLYENQFSPEKNKKVGLEIIKKFNKYISEEKPYLYHDISEEDVAAQLGTNRTYLSKAINEVFNKNFTTIINEFRIRAARQIITDARYNHLSLEAIAEMVGYNSRTTFITNFKKITGLTPSYFRDSVNNK